jgi:hypothetical protein
MAVVRHLAPAILGGLLLALVFIGFLVLALRARRRQAPPPRVIWPTLLIVAGVWILMLLDARFRLPAHGPGTVLADVVVALGTFFVVSVGAAIPLSSRHRRPATPLTGAEQTAGARSAPRDSDTTAKILVATHGLILAYGAFILLAFLVITLIWALAR